MAETYLYIGNWLDLRGTAKNAVDADGMPMKFGVTTCRFDTDTGKLTFLNNGLYDDFSAVGMAYIDVSRGVFYATDECSDYPGLNKGGGGGDIRAYRIDPDDGSLSFLNSKPSYGANPTYLCLDNSRKYLLVANHGTRQSTTITEKDAFGRLYIKVQHDEANVVLFAINDDGSIGEPKDIFRFSGAGPKEFQHSSHVHSIVRAPDKNLFVACDKGGDQIYMLSIDYKNECLTVCPGSPLHRLPGSAPRYSTFHPTLPYLYVNKEHEPRVAVFRYEDDGRLEEIQLIENTVPEEFKELPKAKQSDIQIDKAGLHCYLFIRETNIINVYDIDQTTGKLILKQTVPTRHGVRVGCFSPDGRYLAVSYTYDNHVEILSVNEDGTIGKVVDSIIQPTPATVNFYQV